MTNRIRLYSIWKLCLFQSGSEPIYLPSAIALLGLNRHNNTKQIPEIFQAIVKAKEFELARNLFRRLNTRKVIKDQFLLLAYQVYHFFTYSLV